MGVRLMFKKRHNYKETPEITEIGRLCYKIKHLRAEQNTRIFLVTSSIVGEGKSTVASLLSMFCAHSQKLATLLVDCDLRRPRIHKIFNLPQERGVSDVLAFGISGNSVLKKSRIPLLNIMTAGKTDQNPAELFLNESTQELMMSACAQYDVVILDAPPILPVNDTLLLANHAEAILFVVKAGHTRKKIMERAIELLDDSRSKIAGTVINNAKGILPYYYDYRYYNYKYTTATRV